MGDVTQLLRGAGPPQEPIAVYGHVSYGQPAPAGYDDVLYVVLPDFSSDINFVCEHWPKIHGATFPAAGADVLVVADNQGNRRCVWWAGMFTPWPDPGG